MLMSVCDIGEICRLHKVFTQDDDLRRWPKIDCTRRLHQNTSPEVDPRRWPQKIRPTPECRTRRLRQSTLVHVYVLLRSLTWFDWSEVLTWTNWTLDYSVREPQLGWQEKETEREWENDRAIYSYSKLFSRKPDVYWMCLLSSGQMYKYRRRHTEW